MVKNQHILESPTTGPHLGEIKIAVKYRMIRERILGLFMLNTIDKFRLLKQVGIDGTELQMGEKINLTDIEKAIDETGVQVHGVMNGSNSDIVSAIEFAKQVGGNSVMVVPRIDLNMSYQSNFQHWQDLVRKAIPLAEQTGVKLCIENVQATFLKTAEEMVRFIDSFESPAVRSYFDAGNAITWTGQPAEHWAKTLGNRIYKIDIKDRGHPVFGNAKLRSKGVEGTHRGEVNWVKVKEELAQVSYSGWVTAEVASGDKKWLYEIAEWLRELFEVDDQ